MIVWLAAAAVFFLALWAAALFRLRGARSEGERLHLEIRLERERAEEARREMAFLASVNHSFVEQATAAMLLVDTDRKLTYLNPAAAAFFGLPSSSAAGKPLIEVVRDHDLETMVRRVLGGTAPAEELEVRPPGTDLILQARAWPIHGEDGQLLGATIVVENMTEVHRLEAVRREFVANVSHELRTPLASIKALVETLEAGALDERPVALDFMAKINRELDNLTALVRDLLELSRIESGRLALHLERVDLGEILEETVGRLRPAAERANLTLTLPPGEHPWVMADPTRVGQILINLIQNAIKFTPSGRQIAISARRMGREAIVAVADTGIGIPGDDLPRIFERFYKVDKARSRGEASGTGLGLAIAKHLVQAMGGHIWAESEEGRGSTFSFALMAAPEGEPAEAAAPVHA
ncbi:MAG: sensor histidine kinase [Chloroflexota bacterium]